MPTNITAFYDELRRYGDQSDIYHRSNPKGYSDTERVMRTIKEDIVWPYEWDNPFDFEIALNKWINNYIRTKR
ncbi:MAG: hypothetical protein AB1481_04310 [Candidatus Omnitrophota bacterium]